MYYRILENTIKEKINKGKAIVIVGARQVGKTTLINKILKDKDFLFLDADDPTIRILLLNPNTEQIRTIIANNKIIFIDEAQRIEKLLQALALQMGSEVNYNELSQLVGINKITIQKYIEILERDYIIFRLNSYSKNIRNEIKRNRKIYFYDNGIRNIIIGNFMQIALRHEKLPETFIKAYNAKTEIIDRDNFRKFVTIKSKAQQPF